MRASVLTQLAALKGASAPDLKAKWRELFDTEPPAYNRRFLESRLAYRIQELAYGGLSRQTLERLQAMAKQYATRDASDAEGAAASPHCWHQADPGMAGCGALRDGTCRRLRVFGPAL